MKLAPGTPLALALRFDAAGAALPVGRLAMTGALQGRAAGSRAVLEWDARLLAAPLPVAPLFYPPEPGLHEARGLAFDGLHGFLADSLPDGWGALLMQRRLARMGHSWTALGPVDRLALVGQGGRGALTFAPATTPADDAATLDLDELAAQSRAILLGDDSTLADTLARLGGASGGARPKVHVGFAPDGRVCVDGDADSVAGEFSQWIVKFPALNDPVDIGAVEQAYALMARAAGLTMTETRLLPAAVGSGHFATRRFDRPAPGRRLHMVSLAGAAEAPSEVPSLDYDGFLRATRAITRHEADVAQAFARMVFNVLAHNRDDHTRQHAYLMDPAGTWRLAPAYDLTWAEGPGGEHVLAIEGEGRTPTRAHVERLGKRHGLSPAMIAATIERTRAALADWPRTAAEAGVTRSRTTIADSLQQVDRMFMGG